MKTLKGLFASLFTTLSLGCIGIAIYSLIFTIILLLLNIIGINTYNIINFIGTHPVPNLIFFFIFLMFGVFNITILPILININKRKERGSVIGTLFLAVNPLIIYYSVSLGSLLYISYDILATITTLIVCILLIVLPIIIFVIFKPLLKNLSNCTDWLKSFNIVFGFIEVVLCLRFFMIADQTMHWDILGRDIYIIVLVAILSLLGIYLLIKIRFARNFTVILLSIRLALAIGVFSFVVYLIPGISGAPLKEISGYLPPMSSMKLNINRVKNVNAGRKYADFLHLPHQLDGYFDLKEAKAAAKAENKPVLVYITGHTCNNCREMEYMVWSNDQVLPMLREDFVICALYVDDMTKVEGGKRLGAINSKLAQDLWGINTAPAYIIISPNGKILSGPCGYNTDINDFINFLEMGQQYEYWNNEQYDNYVMKRSNATSIVVGGDKSSPNILWTITAEKEGDGIFVITFDGAIAEGYHGYPMTDFSAPIFDFFNAEAVGDVVETLTPEEHGIDELTGEPAFIYEHQAIYVQNIEAKAGQMIGGCIYATICNNEFNQYTPNIVVFTIQMPGKK